jgi:alpha-L-rhamnosidase
MLNIADLKTEYQINPLGIDVPRPRFSWILKSDQSNTTQTAYRIVIAANDTALWDSFKVESAESVLVEYAGNPLLPRTQYHITLEVWDNHGGVATVKGWFETGLMYRENFKGSWITHNFEDTHDPCPIFFKDFSLSKKIKTARIYASALGIYEITLNGQKAGNAFFAPGWTSYHKRVQYQTYDVTGFVRENNRLEITVAKGWFAGEYGWELRRNYGNCSAVWAQIEIGYENGGGMIIAADESWQYGSGPTRFAELYHGEIIDHTAAVTVRGGVTRFDYPMEILTAQESEPVRITGRIKPTKCITTPKGETVFDFGQNLTGVVEARLTCPPGTTVTLRHAEVLDRDGNFYTENLRRARASDTFICRGGGEEVFMPRFTFHGFRYVKVEGLEERPENEWFTACVMHTDMEETGSFECSHEGINCLQKNIQWGQRGNFLDIPTDCPQRDERLGWTGDVQIFASTAAFNYNTALFFTKWLRDLKAEQTAKFGVPHVIPNIIGDREGAAAWSDAATVVPWTIYQTFGDKRLLVEQYESMKGWVEYIRSKAGDGNLWQSGFQYADWLALDREEGSEPPTGATDVYLVASAYYAYSTAIVARAAKVLCYDDDANRYAQLHRDILSAFQKEYVTRTGRMVSETQTACVLALHFNLGRVEHRPQILRSLIDNLARHGNHLRTGFVGTPYLCHTLSENGCHELAGTVFMQEDFPSWLYSVNLGATTIWERWNSMHEDGNFDESGMNSFNHYAYGSIGSWMYQKLGGLQIVEPGYKKSRVAPMPIRGIDRVKASLKTVYGTLSCQWRRNGVGFMVDINIPSNTSAIVRLPGREGEFILGSGVYNYEYRV